MTDNSFKNTKPFSNSGDGDQSPSVDIVAQILIGTGLVDRVLLAKLREQFQDDRIWTLNRDRNGYRLPQSFAWVYACQAGSRTRVSSGDTPVHLRRYCTYAASANVGTTTVGERWCNGWGLFDMHGNVAEWCHDHLPGNPERQQRGGDRRSDALDCDALRLRGRVPVYRFNIHGFRVAQGPSRSGTEGSTNGGETAVPQ